MATTAIWDVTDRLKRVIDYAANPEKTAMNRTQQQSLQQVLAYTRDSDKTEKQLYVGGINCDPLTAYEQMQRTKRQFQKTAGIVAFHAYQAFAPGEATPEIAHAIGMKLAQELWGERFEVIVSTHLDKQHLHNHFVLNSVSFLDGKRYYDNKASYARLRQTSDRLCHEHALSVIEHPEPGKARHYGEWKADQENKPTWRGLIRTDVDQALAASMTWTQFIATLQKQGYEVKPNVKHLAVRPPGKQRFVRLRSLGDAYTEEALKQRILRNRIPHRPPSSPKSRRRPVICKGKLKSTKRFSGLQALYIRYLYQLGIWPARRASSRRTPFLLREDLRHMAIITAQTKLLCLHRISSKEQLLAFASATDQQIHQLCGERKMLYNRIRRANDAARIEACKTQIAELSRRISGLRKEVRLCAGILARSVEMSQKLQVSQQHNPTRKENTRHEQWSRSGRSGSKHEPAGH
ncbi:relaxase/mobilization nuclease domain-containing protein [Paenibacillus athensensis]|uniref:Relaxase n=1 Tax=Paenibacillus athensensis TaxID=1967502 RepID=A0A4Y8Q0Z4_9BACL|nr:relaxase/mobilization nuclease domain-containing protein [Paenibacillus athensensis]MCD1261350.1 relaxase/mobilization nuclease domain-containing protein [Paenibacillus athensensis]